MTRTKMTHATVSGHVDPKTASHEKWEFRLIFAATFVIFLLVAAVSRLLPAAWRPAVADSAQPLSIIGEARILADTFIPFAFMA